MDEEDVADMLVGIERIAQCPVCLDVAKPPVTQCSNGHISCGQCREPLAECSMCRGPFIATNNRVVEELLDFLPKNCRYSDKGCSAVSLLDHHTKYCAFRPIKCLVGKDKSCDWSGTVNEWKEHVQTHHSVKSYEFDEPVGMSFSDFAGDWQSFCYYQKVNEESFLYYVWKEGNKSCHSIKHVQCGKPKKEYYFKVKFVTEENLFYKALIQATPFKEDETLENHPTVFLLSDLNNITKEDGSLNITVEALQIDFPKKE